MKKIKIIRGTYGMQNDAGMVIPVGVNDGPIILVDAKAQRLIDIGVAELVEDIPDVIKTEPAKQQVKTSTAKSKSKTTTTTKSKKTTAPKIDAVEVM